MKRVALLTVFLVVSSFIFAKKIDLEAKVDERCELLSTVFRLVDAREYVTYEIPSYIDNLNEYFAPYKNHEIIEYLKTYRENYGVGYDAPMSLAIHLQIVDGNISLTENVKENSLDKRWGKGNLPRLIELLNDFYRTSKFHDFFISQSDFILTVEQSATEYFMQVDMDWYGEFYGEVPNGTFNLIISLSNGGNNYGPKVEYLSNEEDLYSIIGCEVDSLNNPVFSNYAIDLVIHEFCHSFCNHLIIENYDKMKEKADKFFELKQEVLSRQAYTNSQTMLFEILVRASVIKYTAEHYPINLESYFSTEKKNGFIWIEELYNSLLIYEENRAQYLTLKSYMPEIVKVQNNLNLKIFVEEQEKQMPLMSIKNIKNNQQDVDAATTTQIIVAFSKKMNTNKNGSTFGKKGEAFFPKFIEAKWDEETKTEWIVKVKLEQNKEYSIAFLGQWFFSEDGTNAKNTIYLDFKTK